MSGGLTSALYTAVGGLQAQSEVLAATAENIANEDTDAYKRWVATLNAGRTSGAPTVNLQRDPSQGYLYQTGNPTDVAINGNGYFQVQLPGGQVAYTRAGNFQVSATGQLTDLNGNPLAGNILVQLGATISIAADGTVSETINGVTQTAGQLGIFTFPNERALVGIGGNLVQPSDASGPALAGTAGSGGNGFVVQGAIETSNVDLETEFLNLILAKNAYKASARVVTTADDMMKVLLATT
jgi:flagellar basal-body rod protein FlgG